MGAFLSQNILSLIFGITTVVTSLIALHYMRLEQRREVEEVIDGGRKVRLFLSREAMIKYLLEMYDKALSGDVIWAQCVRCTDFTPVVRKKILEAAGKGVRFQMVINRYSPTAKEFRVMFDPIEGAEIIEAPDNALSMQGLSNREVVITLPEVESYTAVLVRDGHFVEVVHAWYVERLRRLRGERASDNQFVFKSRRFL